MRETRLEGLEGLGGRLLRPEKQERKTALTGVVVAEIEQKREDL